jgi:16S rRNA (uracil1498-N3)-methyltransferase
MELEWDSLPRPLLIADPAVGEAAFAGRDAGADAPPQAGQGVTVMVGPEGGWTNAEVQAATERGARPLSLGPRVLRADSAGVVALTLLQYLRGDLRGASE